MTKNFERLVGEHHRYVGRRDPRQRPPGAVPVEFVLLLPGDHHLRPPFGVTSLG
jgi:hypothetical protein